MSKKQMITEKKKAYIAPAIEVVEFENKEYMLDVSGGEDGPGWGGSSEGGFEPESNRHRGEWGNLWKN